VSEAAKCATCRHWGAKKANSLRNDEKFDDYGGTELSRKAVDEGWMICRFVPHYVEDGHRTDALALVQDGSGYVGNLYTHPEFFCAHWKPKEVEG
jgi:hypothetical protein